VKLLFKFNVAFVALFLVGLAIAGAVARGRSEALITERAARRALQ